MPTCAISTCSTTTYPKRKVPGMRFYRFPKNEDLRAKWIEACDRSDKLNVSGARICSRHFDKKFYYRRPIDIALGLTNPSRFRNLAEDAVPTLNLPPKNGEWVARNEDENSIASIDCKDLCPESSESDAGSEAPRYYFSTGAIQQEKKTVTLRSEDKCPSTVESEINPPSSENTANCITVRHSGSSQYIILPSLGTLVPSVGTVTSSIRTLTPVITKPVTQVRLPPSTIKQVAPNTKNVCPKVTENVEKKTATTEAPYMEFFTDYHVPNGDVGSSCDNIIEHNSEILDTSNKAESQYIILKRSVWKSMEERLQRHCRRTKETNEYEAKFYSEAVGEIERLKGRLASCTEGATEDVARLKLQVASLQRAKEVLVKENRALKKDKEKLEERFKKHAILLKQYFTTGQLKRLFCDDGERRLRWNIEDIKEALILKTQSTAAYRFLQDKFSFLLPDLRTLRRWSRLKKHLLEEKASANPSKPLSEQDKVLQNLFLLQEQTDNGEETMEMDIAQEEVVNLIVEE